MSETSSLNWVTVSQAAAALGKSERTIQRQAKSGKLTARRETTEEGIQWLISLDGAATVTTGDDNSSMGGDVVTPAVTTPVHAQNTLAATPQLENGDSVTKGDDTSDDTKSLLNAREELVIELRDQVKFLRSALEARDRDAAELRAALRTALAAMPKALPEGQTSTRNDVIISRENAPESPQTSATTKVSSYNNSAAKREPRPLWKLILGIR